MKADDGNQFRVGGAAVLFTMFVIGLFYQPVLWIFMGVMLVGLLLLFLVMSSSKVERGAVNPKPSHSAARGGQGSLTRSASSSAKPTANVNQTILLVVGIIVGFLALLIT